MKWQIARAVSRLSSMPNPKQSSFNERLGFESFEVQSGELGDRPVPKMMILPLGSIPKPDEGSEVP